MAILTREAIIEKFLEKLPAHIGYANIISQLDKNQGDTSQRLGTLATLLILTDKDGSYKIWLDKSGHKQLEDSMQTLEVGYGRYRRTSNPAEHGSDPRNESRDQLSIIKVGMATMHDRARLAMVLLRQTLRLGFHQNYYDYKYQIPDPPALGEVSTYLRGLLGPVSLFATSVLDIGFLVDLAFRDPNNWDTDNMYALNLIFSDNVHPTIWSRIAMKRYLKTNFMSRLWNYHKDQDGNNGCEPLYWLFRLAYLDKYGYQPTDAP